jgi:hypothetical protein
VSAEPEIVTAALGPSEARRLTDQVKRDAQELWKKLLALYEGGAHTALGYDSWGAYAAEEFGVGKSHAYRLLDAGRVAALIEGDSPNWGLEGANVGDHRDAALLPRAGLNEAQARELAPLLRHEGEEAVAEAWQDLHERHGDDVSAVDVRQLVRGNDSARSSAIGLPLPPADRLCALCGQPLPESPA